MAKIADLIISLTAQTAEFRSAMSQAAGSVQSLEGTVKSAHKTVNDFVAAFAGYEIFNALKRSAEATIEWASSIEKLSERTGLSAQAASALTVSAREQGVQIDTLQNFMQRLTMEVAKKPQEFAKMGIAIRDSAGNLLSLTQIASNTVKGLEEYKQGTDRSAAATVLLGKGAGTVVESIGRLGDTFAGVAHAAKLAQDLGLELDKNQIAQAREWERSLADLQLAFLAIQNQLGKALLPEVKKFTDEIIRLSADGTLKRWAEEAGGAFHLLGEAIGGDLMILDGFIAASKAAFSILDAPGRLAFGIGHPGEGEERQKLLLPGTAADQARWARERTARDAADAAAGEGTKRFIGPNPAADKLAEQYAALHARLIEAFHAQEMLVAAGEKGPAAIKAANVEIEIQKDLLQLRNNKLNTAVSETSAMGQAVANLVRQTESLKTAFAVEAKTNTLTSDIAGQQLLIEAQGRGAAATRQVNDAIKAHNELVALGIDADSRWGRQIAALVAQDENLKRTLAAGQEVQNLRLRISQQEELNAAYSRGADAVRQAEAAIAAQNEIIKLGISPTSALADQIRRLSQQESELKHVGEVAKQTADDLKNAFKTAATDIIGAFEGMASGTKTWQQSLLDLDKQFGQLALDLLVIKPLERYLSNLDFGGGGGLLGSLFPGLSGGSPAAAATAAPTFEAGGIVGLSGTMKSVSPSVFAGAPRFLGGGMVGLGADEVPIIAHRGEQVVPVNQVGKDGGGRPIVLNMSMTVVTPDADSFRQSQGQILADAHRHMTVAARRHT